MEAKDKQTVCNFLKGERGCLKRPQVFDKGQRECLGDHKSCLKKKNDGIMIGSAKYSIYKCITALTPTTVNLLLLLLLHRRWFQGVRSALENTASRI